MLRKCVVLLFIFAGFILQCSVFGHIAFAGIIPNVMIILTASFGFMRGEKEGLAIGFACGLLLDIFFGDFLGFYALVMMYTGYLNGKFSRVFYPEDIKLPMALIVASDLSYGTICYILLFMLRGKREYKYYFAHVIFPEVLYTIVVTLFLYPLVLKVNELLEAWERKRARTYV